MKVGPLLLAGTLLFGCGREGTRPKPVDLYEEHLRVARISIEAPKDTQLSAEEILRSEETLRKLGLFGKDTPLMPPHTKAYSIIIPSRAKGFVYIFGENHVSRPGKFKQYLALESLIKNREITTVFGEGGYGPAQVKRVPANRQYARILKEKRLDQTVAKIAESYSCAWANPCVDVHYVDDPELVGLNFITTDGKWDIICDIRSVKAAANIDRLMECERRTAAVYGDAHSYLLQSTLAAHGYASVTLVADDMNLSEDQDRRNYSSDVKERRKQPPKSGWRVHP